MQEYIIPLTAFAASLLTFFSGFGLGTILVPVLIVFFPVELAIMLTSIVHLLNNLFKFLLIGKHIDLKVAIKFGAPALIGAFFGAQLLFYLSAFDLSLHYELFNCSFQPTLVKLIIGILLFLFATYELFSWKKMANISDRFLLLGGTLSGFFGGLSGNQGALRTAFLINCGLSKEGFIATGIAIACIVDITRIPIYFSGVSEEFLNENFMVLTLATTSAFLGAVIGRKLLNKVTFRSVQLVVAVLIMTMALLLITGII